MEAFILNTKVIQIHVVNSQVTLIEKASKKRDVIEFTSEQNSWEYISSLGFTKKQFSKTPF